MKRTIDIFVRDIKGRPLSGASIEFFLNGTAAGYVPNSDGRGRIEGIDPADRVEVAATFGDDSKRVQLGPNQESFTFQFGVDPMPDRKVHPDLIDAFIILLLASAIAIFIFWMATQFISSPVFQKLPSFITDTYTAIWSSVVAGAAGIGAAILKAFNRPAGAQTPNYLLYTLGTTLGIIVVILGIAFIGLSIPAPPTPPK